jgi:hypothetical protein
LKISSSHILSYNATPSNTPWKQTFLVPWNHRSYWMHSLVYGGHYQLPRIYKALFHNISSS